MRLPLLYKNVHVYFTTTANDRSETKAVWDTIMEPILDDVHLRQGECYNCLLQYILYTKASHIAYSCKNKFTKLRLPKVFLQKFPQVVLTNCVVHHRHLMEVNTDTEVGWTKGHRIVSI